MATPASPTIRVTLTLEGEIVIDRLLAGIESRATDLRPAWPAVVQAFRLAAARAFATEGASGGAPWAPLAKSTQAERKRLGFPPAHPILQRTGTLARSLTVGDGGYTTATATSLSLGSRVPYFRYHQSPLPRKRLPRRAVLLTGDDRNALMRPIRLYLTGRSLDAPPRGAIG